MLLFPVSLLPVVWNIYDLKLEEPKIKYKLNISYKPQCKCYERHHIQVIKCVSTVDDESLKGMFQMLLNNIYAGLT